ncbi:uncharacterized protein LOC124156475 isoform X2 [Ischnura elegans]|uniref:uncharacterized protein LOC124156475 isoform X2 n=1 Tax=Ischnura elegans TaxID=197161 RepID=UPI001ED8815A|nr:uncharacterized protein LOC124156475 isoform X2 [Ischnura elegans]
MESETSVKEGYLLFPPHGMLGQLKKSWHKKYCQLFNLSQHGIKRLEIFDSEDDVRKSNSVRIITLENCVKISQDSQKHQQFVIMVVTKTLTLHFAAFTQEDMREWVVALQTVAFPSETSTKTVEEDNELYCSSAEGVYHAKLISTEASDRCGLAPGPYTLLCLESEIQLMGQSRILLKWPYHYIRRYGQREGTFTFEAGRKCPSGAGSFQFAHSYGTDVFRCISSRMKNMRKVLSSGGGGDFPMPPSLPCTPDADKVASMPVNYWSGSKNDESGSNVSLSNAPTVCVDDLLQAVLNNMEAGSRSPLSAMPPFGSGLSINMDSINSSLEDMAMKNLRSSVKPVQPSRSTRLHGNHSVSNPSIKQKINELSVLSVGKAELPNSPPDNDAVSPKHSYDKVEFREDAWKTMGLSEMPHLEVVPVVESGANFTKERKKARERHESDVNKPSKSKILMNCQDSGSGDDLDDNYDKLQHLGTQSSKRSFKNSDQRYKHVTPISLTNAESQATLKLKSTSGEKSPDKQPPSWNAYDNVQNCMQAVRLADDSHLGYGMIRKKVVNGDDSGLIANVPSHTFHNEIEYAVIEKPKKSSPKL